VWLRGLITVFIGLFVLLPIVKLAIGSFRQGGPLDGGPLTLQNYRGIFTVGTWHLVENTLIFAAGQTLVPLVFGVGLAWLLTRTNIPWAGLWEYATISLFFIPFLAGAIAWIILLGPGSGVINVALRNYTGWGGISVYSMTGLIIVQSIYLIPLVFLVVGASFRSVNPELEEAARTSGANPWWVFFHVTLSVSRPAVISAGLLCFIIGVGSLDVPLILGYPGRVYMFTNIIYESLTVPFPPDYGHAAGLSMVLLVFGTLLLWFYMRATRHGERYVTVAGQARRASPTRIGRWRWVAFAGCAVFFFFTAVLPLAAVIVGSLLPYIGQPSFALYRRASLHNYHTVLWSSAFWHAVKNSLILSIGAGMAVMLIGTLIAYVGVRTRSRWSSALEVSATLPLTLPPTILAFGFLLTYISFSLPGGYSFYGTLWVMGFAYIAFFIPIAVRQMSGSMMQLSADLEHASRVSGATQIGTLARIVFPLLKQAMWGGFLLAFVTFMREFANSVLLYSPGREVLSVVMYNYYAYGQMPDVAVIAVFLSILPIALMLLMAKAFNVRIRF
jgi:iron(III) transport system permease protein